MSLNIENCPRCKKIYAKNTFGMCGNCLKEIEQEYEKCTKYLRENRKCTLNELSEATEVSIKQISKFIREGRISIANAPNMEYACEVCGARIREGSMCDSCRSRLSKDVKHLHEDENRRAVLRNSSEVKATYQIKKEK